jgi:hypothetical protein
LTQWKTIAPFSPHSFLLEFIIMARKPFVFIGSSSEGSKYAEALQLNLNNTCESQTWNQGFFGLSDGTLEALVNAIDQFDFAVLVLTEDDITVSRNIESKSPRDNVIFELGLFMGGLGRHRVYVVANKAAKLPSDLAGITIASFEHPERSTLQAALGSASTAIKDKIQKHGLRENEKMERSKKGTNDSLQHRDILERGSIKFSDLLIDGSMVIQDDNSVLHNDLRKAIFMDEIIPMKYLYCTDDGCEYWLEICSKPEYTFYTNSESLLKRYANELTDILFKESGTNEFDVISLGTGNGVKDTIVIRSLLNKLKGAEILYYYPIEISSPMLIKSVKYLLSNCQKRNLRTKAILGDFNLVDKYEPIYQERENPNLFSLLGNSIGNSDEPSLLESLNHSLHKGDFLLIEANTRMASLKEFCEDEINKRHDFSPLLSLGVKYDPAKLDYKVVENESQIPNTKSVLAVYKSAFIGEKEVNNIKLSIVHHYDKDSFIKHFQDNYGLNFIKSWTNNNATIFLFKHG